MNEIVINSEYVTLGQFLKLVDVIQSGGHAKFFLLENEVLVNNAKENRRGRKLYSDDIVTIANFGEYKIVQK